MSAYSSHSYGVSPPQNISASSAYAVYSSLITNLSECIHEVTNK